MTLDETLTSQGELQSLSTLQDSYRRYANAGQLSKLRFLHRDTAIKPSEELMHELYNHLVEDGLSRVSSKRAGGASHNFKTMISIIKETGIQPSEDIGRRVWSMLQEGNLSYTAIDVIKAMANFTPSEEMIHEALLQNFRNGNYDTMFALKTAYGTNPKIPENEVQEKYSIWLKKGNFRPIEWLMKMTGIKPNEAAVQDAYMNYATRGKIHRLKLLKEVTGYGPSEEVMQRIDRYVSSMGNAESQKGLSAYHKSRILRYLSQDEFDRLKKYYPDVKVPNVVYERLKNDLMR